MKSTISIVLLDVNKSRMLFSLQAYACFLKLCYKLLYMYKKSYKEEERIERKYKDSTKKTDSEKERRSTLELEPGSRLLYLYKPVVIRHCIQRIKLPLSCEIPRGHAILIGGNEGCT